MTENDLKVIVKAKELAVHSFKLTSNINRYPKKYRRSISHGNCYGLGRTMDEKVAAILKTGL